MHLFVRAFLALWFGQAGLIGIVMLTAMIRKGELLSSGWLPLFPLGFVAAGYGLVRFGKFLARNEAPLIRDFLADCADERCPPRVWPRPASLVDLIPWLRKLLIRLGALISRR